VVCVQFDNGVFCKMTIAHLTTGHPAFDTRVFHKQCKSLASFGYNVTLVVPHDKDVLADGVQIKAITVTENRLNRLILSPWRVYKVALSLDADLYHLHDPNLLPVGLALKRRGKIVFFDSHEDYPADIMSKEWIPLGLRKYISAIYAKYEKHAFKKFDAVITVHEQIQERIIKFQPNAFVVKNFPIVDAGFQPNEQRQAKFVWLGVFSPIRGSFQVDAAIEMKINASLDVIGTVLDFQPSSDKIKLLGVFSHHEAMRMASQYLAGLVTYLPEPNYADAMPNKLFEYMMMGLPVIASNFPKWRSIIEDANCGILVDPKSPQEIAKAMQWMLDNQQEAFEMGMRGRAAVLQKYNWASEERILFSVYKEFSK
jgi:glycosyltransferase involved in cell wall biosynthesis